MIYAKNSSILTFFWQTWVLSFLLRMALISFLFGYGLFSDSLWGWICTLFWDLRCAALNVVMSFEFRLLYLWDIGVLIGNLIGINIMTGVEPVRDVFLLDFFLNVLYAVGWLIDDSFGWDFYLDLIFYQIIFSLLQHEIEIFGFVFVIIEVIVCYCLKL